jgi:hypothetical protein
VRTLRDISKTSCSAHLCSRFPDVQASSSITGEELVRFDGVPATPLGLDDVSKLPFITRELLHRGFSSEDLKKILGENVLRVLAANEHGAKQG